MRAVELLTLVIGALCLAGAARAQTPQILDFRVAVSSEFTYSAFYLELNRLGESRRLELVDDGSTFEDIPWDGVYVARDTGAWSRVIETRLLGLRPDGEEELLFSGLVRTEDRHRVIVGWYIKQLPEEGSRALRTAVAYPDGAASAASSLPLVVAFGWGIFVLCAVGWLARRPES